MHRLRCTNSIKVNGNCMIYVRHFTYQLETTRKSFFFHFQLQIFYLYDFSEAQVSRWTLRLILLLSNSVFSFNPLFLVLECKYIYIFFFFLIISLCKIHLLFLRKAIRILIRNNLHTHTPTNTVPDTLWHCNEDYEILIFPVSLGDFLKLVMFYPV